MNNQLPNIEYEKVKCLFCNDNDEQQHLFKAPDRINNLPGEFSVVKCKNCGFVFQNPRPKEKFIKYFYPDSTGYFQPQEKPQSKLKKIIEKQILINYFSYHHLGKKNILSKSIIFPIYFIFYRDKTLPKFIKNGKLLDIGCSHGLFLEKMKKLGWDTIGLEPNEKAASYGNQHRNLDIKIGTFENYNFEPNSFDVIVLNMVLEHLYQPDQVINNIEKWLKPGGQLIITIPYFNGLEFKTFKEYTYALHLPAHINFFNKNNIKKLLENFKKVNFVFQHFPRDVVASASYKYKDHNNIFLKLISTNKYIRSLLIKPSLIILSWLGLTSRVTIKAEK